MNKSKTVNKGLPCILSQRTEMYFVHVDIVYRNVKTLECIFFTFSHTYFVCESITSFQQAHNKHLVNDSAINIFWVKWMGINFFPCFPELSISNTKRKTSSINACIAYTGPVPNTACETYFLPKEITTTSQHYTIPSYTPPINSSAILWTPQAWWRDNDPSMLRGSMMDEADGGES